MPVIIKLIKRRENEMANLLLAEEGKLFSKVVLKTDSEMKETLTTPATRKYRKKRNNKNKISANSKRRNRK